MNNLIPWLLELQAAGIHQRLWAKIDVHPSSLSAHKINQMGIIVSGRLEVSTKPISKPSHFP